MEQNEPLINKNNRRCAVTRLEKPQSEMVRYVADMSGNIFPDVSARAPGRGVWVSANSETLEQAIKTNAFARSLKRAAHPKPELIEQTKTALFQKSLGLLAMARRAGQLILGFDQVSEAIKKTAPAFLIEAYDASNDGRDKIIGLSKKWGDVQIIGCFCIDDLGKTLSRDNIVHAFMPKGQFAQNWALEINRLAGFVPLKPQDWIF